MEDYSAWWFISKKSKKTNLNEKIYNSDGFVLRALAKMVLGVVGYNLEGLNRDKELIAIGEKVEQAYNKNPRKICYAEDEYKH